MAVEGNKHRVAKRVELPGQFLWQEQLYLNIDIIAFYYKRLEANQEMVPTEARSSLNLQDTIPPT